MDARCSSTCWQRDCVEWKVADQTRLTVDPGCVVSGLSGLYIANSPANSQSWTKWNGNSSPLSRKIKDKVAQMCFIWGKGGKLRRLNFPSILFNILVCKLPASFRLIFAGPCTNFMQEPMTSGGLKASHGRKSRSCARWSNLGPVESFASNMIKSVNETKWSSLASQDPCSYSLYFDLNICFRARKVTGTSEKRAPDSEMKRKEKKVCSCLVQCQASWKALRMYTHR